MTMFEYIEECVQGEILSLDASFLAIEFYKKLKEQYPNLEMDASPICRNGFLFALDDGVHHTEFELCDGVWEFFYMDRETEEMYDCIIENFDFSKIDKYLRRAR